MYRRNKLSGIISQIINRKYILAAGVFPLSLLAISHIASASAPPQASSPEAWRTPEFAMQWGLASIGAEYAYARGYTGRDITIGVLDETIIDHEEFSGKLSKISPEDPYNYGVSPGGWITIGTHGNHVAGIAAARRDGVGMHGVAYEANILAAKYLGNPIVRSEQMIQSAARIINNSWGYPIRIVRDEQGNPIWLPNGTPYYSTVTLRDNINYYAPVIGMLNELSLSPVSKVRTNYSSDISMLRAARENKLIVFAAGNGNNYNIPVGVPSLPYFSPDVFGNFLVVTNLTPRDDLHVSSTSCGFTASYCLSAPGTNIYSTGGRLVSITGGGITANALLNGELAFREGYEYMTGTSMAAPLTSGAAAVLMQRFPYMTSAQIADVLKTTATDLGAPGLDARFGWGKLNLRAAIDGPGMFVTPEDIPEDLYISGTYTDTQFIVNLPGIGAILEPGTPQERVCASHECAWDRWDNNISGHGGLTKTGSGTLVLNGNNTYTGPTLVNQGWLLVNGALTSGVTVEQQGILGGSGQIGALRVGAGGTLAPGNSTGTLTVLRDVQFDPGSLYRVEINRDGQSDAIHTAGAVTLNGGDVSVLLAGQENLLTQDEVHSLAGRTYSILTAANGIHGAFRTVAPDYLFIGTQLNYQPERIGLAVGRNSTAFTSVAETKNQREVARAADQLAAGHPVYESILASTTAAEARQAFSQLTGQIYADVAGALLSNSRYLRDTLNSRLRQATSSHALWVETLGGWDKATGTTNATGYRASTYGVLIGADKPVSDKVTLGVAGGVTRSALNGANRAHGDSNNYHLAAYGALQSGALALRGGLAHTWHRIDAERRVKYGAQADKFTASYQATTRQLFSELGYTLSGASVSAEPFGRFSYTSLTSHGFSERGGAAALQGKKKTNDAVLSTLGLRGSVGWQVGQATVSLRAEAGWQHQYNSPERSSRLAFTPGGAAFTAATVKGAKDSAVASLSGELTLNPQTTLSIGYSGLSGAKQQDNSVHAGIRIRF
ncbi:autotransporter domain-containing protein [Shimwellia blattae]|uniref:Extracellular serine protease n=2 Tax=Shimwellia blattae TaxID=563 RepID=I2B7E5_SHIBC|nr:extracellular serine protease precursor [Shimwellia blattae DSM 4481 = NBRC 105725]GAB80030.1 hypothetical protein EB105725_04_01410 [Shimwellia blattae DSM 4481 = NBRC 105725]VDY63917.1 Extracellular serine protease precursor [Shimwellia blattae]VEC22053.1 Extracellular serine protease precursor [Shimwellia blattae]